MRYVPKELTGNVNISRRSPLKELANLLFSLSATIVLIYIALGFLVDIIIPWIPQGVEKNLGKFYEPLYLSQHLDAPFAETIQKLLDRLTGDLKPNKGYKVYVVENSQVNALALPGGTIIVYSELLKQLGSENELAFVLAHELGHFDHKDHLRALGRGLVFFVVSSVFFGQENQVNKFLGNSLTKAEMKFSQRQEQKADFFAIELLVKRYGNASGAIEFLNKIKEKEKMPRFFYFFATHPHPLNRIRAAQDKIKKEGYLLKEPVALDAAFKEFFKKDKN